MKPVNDPKLNVNSFILLPLVLGFAVSIWLQCF